MPESVETLLEARQQVRENMGGKEKVDRIHARGGFTVRDRIAALVDPGSFFEEGTFVRSAQPADRERTPGDGIIGGLARIDGRPVTVVGNDVTVKGGSDAQHAASKLHRLYNQALELGNPFILLGEAAGSRVPDVLGSESLTRTRGGGMTWMATRKREIPVITVIVGRSFGESSFMAALSDVIIQVQGSVLAVTSPRVIEVATSEKITEEELGGRTVQETITGQIDLGVDTEKEAFDAVREILAFLPSNCNSRPPRVADVPAPVPDERLREMVPDDRRRAYDMRRVVRRMADDGKFLELRPKMAQSVLTGFARLGGRSAGIIASQPMRSGGALTPEACDKMTRFLCLCDAFNVPVISLADSPGFLVGTRVEQDKLLFKAMLVAQALVRMRVPRITVVVRKAFGLSFFALSGTGTGAVALYAWPAAEIGFMDPDVAANVLHAGELENLEPDERSAELLRRAHTLEAGTNPYGAAVHMGVDEIIDPAETVVVLTDLLERLEGTSARPAGPGALSSWPTCW
jgi:methylmalonyl-CoA decarboxylase subunit alpha